jgi:hypothetical protein
VCQGCLDGYYETLKTCTKCTAPCSKCVSSESCTGCITGYTITDTSKCILDADKNCPTGCKDCRGDWDCLECNSGYHKVEFTCCPDTCTTCNPTHNVPFDNCYNCVEGLFFSGGYCLDCPYGCSKCSNDVCLTCISDWVISDKVCVPQLPQ